ncbi:trypsin-like serine peptidase [Yinghuangia soli]|uniref:V8-like Glu-specific endopeptidase n=1 Tax=Yinghuangia soli TaxID=2908204 RepID=A0AA41U486_9ACTN|nr:hypothetical protein [Yinghuangia soli]MCF2530552.1 hypothetical protein [Yinghuangia soli]
MAGKRAAGRLRVLVAGVLVATLALSGCDSIKRAVDKGSGASNSPGSSGGSSSDPGVSPDGATVEQAAELFDTTLGRVVGNVRDLGDTAGQLLLQKYWTPQRLGAATEREPVVDESVQASAEASATAGPAGPEQVGGPAAAPSAGSAGRGVPGLPSSGGAIPQASGKVFFRDPGDGKDHKCSAAAVNSGTRRLLATAAHCVHSGKDGRWMQNWVFISQYQAGSTLNALSAFPARTLRTFDVWIAEGNGDKYTTDKAFSHDVAFVTTANGFSGKRIVDQYGGYGIRTGGYPVRPADVRVLGYPKNMDGGNVEQECVAPLIPRKVFVEVACNYGPGSSGGPWVWRFPEIGWLVGVTSTADSSRFRRNYSPRFGSDVWAMYQATARD